MTKPFLQITLSVLLICIALLFVALVVDWHRLTIDSLSFTLNDQVGYITVARHWVDDGRLDSSIIYPSLLQQNFKRNSLYMPGFYAELALTFRMLGYSPVTARLPAFLSFVVSCVLVYWIAVRLFDTQAAVYSFALFAFFPLNLIYAFTAMAEMPLLAAGLAAFAVFLAVRARFRWWVAPLVLAFPIAFRETGISVGVTMCAMLFFGTSEKRVTAEGKRTAILCGLLACAMLLALVFSPVGSGRPSLWKANILGHGRFDIVYRDAFALSQARYPVRDWVVAIAFDFGSNVFLFFRDFGREGLETGSLLFLLSGIALGFFLWTKTRDSFALGVSLALTLLLIANLCMYTIWYYRGTRTLWLMQPFVAILWGTRIARWTRDRGARRPAVLVVAIFMAGMGCIVPVLLRQHKLVERVKEDTAFLESTVGMSNQLVVSPWLSPDYVNEHYPQQWAFVPSNCETMRLLNVKYTIGTMILPADVQIGPVDAACGTGLRFAGQRVLRGERYWIYHSR